VISLEEAIALDHAALGAYFRILTLYGLQPAREMNTLRSC
jgi:hypothetical protein